MGDIVKTVSVFAIDSEGNKLGPVKSYRALIDTGATSTVIPRRVLRSLKGQTIPGKYQSHDGEPVPSTLVALRLGGARCETKVVVAMVSDKIAAKAGHGTTLILGHDYLQRAEAVLRFDVKPHAASCTPKSKKRRSGKPK